MNQTSFNKFNTTGLNDLIFNLNGSIQYSNSKLDSTSLNIQSKLKDLSLSTINGIINVDINYFTVMSGKTISNINNINMMNINNIDLLGDNSIYINNVYKANYNSFVGDTKVNNFVTNFNVNDFNNNKAQSTEVYSSAFYMNMKNSSNVNYQINFKDFFIDNYRGCRLTSYMINGNNVRINCNNISIY